MKNSKILNLGLFLGIILYGLLLYCIPLQSNGFYFDDHAAIETNQVIRSLDIPKIFDAFNTRSLVGLSFALNYKFGAVNPSAYRLVNILIHCFNAFLVFLLVKSTLRLYPARKPLFSCSPQWPAIFASLLFLSHPLATEPVNFITQRFVLMGTFFYLLTLILYIQYRHQSNKKYLIASIVSAIAAMLCKEFVVTLPTMLFLYEFYFWGSFKNNAWKRWQNLIPFFVIVLIVPILLLKTSHSAVRVANIAASDESHRDITRAGGAIGRGEYFLTEINVVCTYVRLLFIPIHQNVDYDYPIVSDVDGQTIICGMFLLSLIIAAWLLYKNHRMISFSIAWFFVALSVESSFIPIGHVIAEYRVYLATFGFVILIMNLIYRQKLDIKVLNAIAAVIIVACSVLTFQRNNVWKNEFALWNDSIGNSPDKARPINNRGKVYLEEGDYNNALSDFNKAIEINPNLALAYTNRGVTYEKLNNLAQAMADLNKSLSLDPNSAETHCDRGIIYDQQNELDKAIDDYNRAIELDAGDAEAYNNRGNVYVGQNNLPAALSDYTKAIELKPDYVDAYNDRAAVYVQQSDFNHALVDYNSAIKIAPSNAMIYKNRAVIYFRAGSFDQAVLDYTKAIEINPSDAQVYNNRAAAYYKLKEYDKAWVDIHKAQDLGDTVNPKLLNLLKQVSTG